MDNNQNNERLILGVGNPIIDISAESDAKTLEKY